MVSFLSVALFFFPGTRKDAKLPFAGFLQTERGQDMYDILIIGAGITGTFLARELARYELNIALLDKEDDIACGATMANSAIIHSGHDPKPGTLKARLNVRGNDMYEEICRELGCAFSRCSAFVAAVSPQEEQILDTLTRQAQERGVPVNRLDPDEARRAEPHLSDSVTAVLELPSTGIITPWEVAIALAEEAVLNGTDLFLCHRVESIQAADNPSDGRCFQVTARTPDQAAHHFQSRYVIDAAGVYADAIFAMAAGQSDSAKLPFSITPRKGEYFVLDHEMTPLVSRVIYPVPSEKGKGVLAVPTIHGNLLIGPNSDFTDDRDDAGNTAAALAYVRKEIGKTVKDIPFSKVIRNFAGLRPTGTTHDFVIEEVDGVPGFILAAAIESPGLTAAPAIAEYIIDTILAPKLILRPKNSWKRRRPFLSLQGLTAGQYNEKIRENPAFGRIVCRCEQITEGEVLDAIHRPAGARTIKGVKKRCRPGMGRCQGGFCEPLITEILCRELGLLPEELLHMEGGVSDENL